MRQVFQCALTGVFALGAIYAQSTTTSQTYNTGMVGISVNQTARLNILNLNPSTGTAVVCSADLQLLNAGGGTLKQRSVPNIDPGKAVSLDLDRGDIADQAVPRISLRGVVTTPSSAASPAPAPCNLTVTLEIVDNETARTNVVVSAVATSK